jgi:NADH-quinone oxidoreductase subunit C
VTPEEIQHRLDERLGDAAARLVTGYRDPWLQVLPERLLDVCQCLRDDPQLAFDALDNLCGVDYLETNPKKKDPVDPHLEVVYHLRSYRHRQAITLKVLLPRWEQGETGRLPRVPSVSSLWAIAEWHEREAFDLVGIEFTGHPNLRRILCPEDWTGHPLRKDYEFPLEYHGIRGK